MALDQSYYQLWFHSFELANTSGHRDAIQLKLVEGQNLPKEISEECQARKLNAYELLTECNKRLFYDYPLGTKFLLKAKLTDRKNKGTFFYTSYQWNPLKIEGPR